MTIHSHSHLAPAPTPIVGAFSAAVALAMFLPVDDAAAQSVPQDLLVDMASPEGTHVVQSTSSGDVDGDGFDELALISRGSFVGSGDDLIVHRSLDGQTFDPLATIWTGRKLDTVHLVDVDADGALDLLATVGDLNPFPFGHTGPGGVIVHRGVGDGTFGPEILSSFGGGLDECVVGDFDGDGIVDVAAAAQDGMVPIYSGVGDGTFVLVDVLMVTPALPTFTQWTELASADLDGNGVDDLAITTPLDSFAMIHFGRLGSGLLPGRRIDFRDGALDLAFADVDGDGIPDLVVADLVLVVRHGIGDGTFAAPVTIAPFRVTDLSVADVDDDGRVDVCGISSGDAFVWRSLGAGAFERTAWTGVGPTSTSLAPAVLDVTRDGRPDVVVTSSWSSLFVSQGALRVLEGVGGGRFRGWPATTSRVEDVVVADLDDDGHVDLVHAQGPAPGEELGSVRVLRGLGRGVFEEERTLAVRLDARSVAAGDFDADGVLDLAVATDGMLKSVTILRGLGGLQYERHDVVLLNGAQHPSA